jgi:hypothetical protein
MVRLFDDESRRMSLESSITFYLVSRWEIDSRRCPAFDDIDLYIYPLSTWQILFEPRGEELLVWSVSKQAVANA